MCKIAPTKKTEKVKKNPKKTEVTAVTVVKEVRKITQPLNKKSRNLFFQLSQYFWKVQFDTFDTFDNQCDVLCAAFCDSRNVFMNPGLLIDHETKWTCSYKPFSLLLPIQVNCSNTEN